MKKIFSAWEEPYNRVFDIIADIVSCVIGYWFILQYGPMPLALNLAVIAAGTLVFIFKPGISLFIYGFAFFVCTAHINGALAVVIAVGILILVGSNHKQAALIEMTVLVFLISHQLFAGKEGFIGGLSDTIPMALLLLFLFISTKYKDFAPSLIYSLVFGFTAIMTNSFGASIYGYPRLLE